MRIAYVTTALPYGPGESFLVPEIRELARRGNHLVVIPRGDKLDSIEPAFAAMNVDCASEGYISARILRSALKTLLRRPGKVLAAMTLLRGSANPKVWLKNLAMFPKGLWLAEFTLRQGVDHIHAHWATTTSTLAMIASEVSGIPWSFTAHRGDIVGNNLLATKSRHASFVRVISESSRRLIRKIAGETSSERATIVHMGVPAPESRSSRLPAHWPRTVLCPANLIPVKGHGHLLQAMAILKDRSADCVLDIAGQGPLHRSLEYQAVVMGIGDRVRFLGQVPHEDLLARYRTGEIGAVVLPSVDLGGGVHEGIPVVLMEAMSSGVPVVSTASGGIPELLRDNAGLLVPPADPVALADAIGRLIADPSLRARLSEAGRNRIAEDFSIEHVVDVLISHWTPFVRSADIRAEMPDNPIARQAA